MKLLLIGPAGSGKGTIGEMLSESSSIPILSVGQMLREIPKNHFWYEQINRQMEKGELVDQANVASLLRDRLSNDDYKNGFILDGWFRSMEDVKFFDPGFDKAVYLDIPKEESIKRLSSRRTCEECGDVYNIYYNPPKVEGKCDECGGKLVQRDDDTSDGINERLDIFEEETKKVINYLKKKEILVEIDGVGTPQEIFERVKKALGI